MRKVSVFAGLSIAFLLLPVTSGQGAVAGASGHTPVKAATCAQVTPVPSQATEIELYMKKKDRRAAGDYFDRFVDHYVHCLSGGGGWDHNLAQSVIFDTWVSPAQIDRLQAQFRATGLYTKVVETPVPGCTTPQVEGSCTPPTAP